MEDNNNFIYYLVLGAIYLLSKLFGKKKKQAATVPKRKRNIAPPTAASDEPAPISFEDILRELSGNKAPKQEPIPEPVLAEMPTFEPIEERSYADDEIDEIAVDYEVPKAIGSGFKPTPAIERDELTFKRMKGFEINEKEKVNYLEVLSEEDGPAKAFVMSEIFTRKYQ